MKRIPTWLVIAGIGVTAGSTESAASGFMVRENSAARCRDRVRRQRLARRRSRDRVQQSGRHELASAALRPRSAEPASFPASISKERPPFSISGRRTPLPSDNSRNNGQFAFVPHAYAVFDLSERLKGGYRVHGAVRQHDRLFRGLVRPLCEHQDGGALGRHQPESVLQADGPHRGRGRYLAAISQARPVEQNSAVPHLSGSHRPRRRISARGGQLGLGLQSRPARGTLGRHQDSA